MVLAAMYERAVLSVENPQSFGVVREAIQSSFASASVASFLKSLERAGLRIRSFEAVLKAKMLGEDAVVAYGRMGNADQGQIREFYLASLEQVAPELRTKFYKLYAYY